MSLISTVPCGNKTRIGHYFKCSAGRRTCFPDRCLSFVEAVPVNKTEGGRKKTVIPTVKR